MRSLLTLSALAALGMISLACTPKPAPLAAPYPPPPPASTMEPINAGTPAPIGTNKQLPPVVTPSPSGTDSGETKPLPTGGKTYTVVKGDTLYSIARTQLGSPKRVNDIIALNPGLTKDGVLPVGKVLKLPAK